jgi:hypothetical protein
MNRILKGEAPPKAIVVKDAVKHVQEIQRDIRRYIRRQENSSKPLLQRLEEEEESDEDDEDLDDDILRRVTHFVRPTSMYKGLGNKQNSYS